MWGHCPPNYVWGHCPPNYVWGHCRPRSVTVTAAASAEGATLTIQGEAAAGGQPTEVAVELGDTVVSIVVP